MEAEAREAAEYTNELLILDNHNSQSVIHRSVKSPANRALLVEARNFGSPER